MTSTNTYPSLHPDLKALRQFCVRVQKQPYVSDGSKNTFTPSGWSTRRESWLSFEEAAEAVNTGKKVSHAGNYMPLEGIGFLVARSGEGLQTLGGDLDTCRDPETGLISQWATDFIKLVKPFYCEVSLSGCGLRFFSWGNLPGGRDKVFGNGPQDDLPEETKARIIALKPTVAEKIKRGEPAFNGLEFYESGRHLTITGNVIQELCFPKEDQTSDIYKALEPYVVDEAITRITGETSRTGNKLPDLSILDVIDTSGFVDTGGQLLGSHPTLGSATGRNLVVNPAKNVYCWMHNGINAGGDPWIWLACECGAVSWAAAGPGSLRDANAMKLTIAHAVKRGLVTSEEMGKREKQGVRPVSLSNKSGYIGLDIDGALKIVTYKDSVAKLDWFSDCPVYIAVETSASHNTEFVFKGEGARDHRKVCFVMSANDVSEHAKFKAAMINAFGAPNRLGKLTYEIIQGITLNTIKKRRIEAPAWDGSIPLVPGMNLADDVEYKLSTRAPVEVHDGDTNAAKHVLRDLLGMHKYAPILVATVMGAPAFARWHVDDRFGLGLWGLTGTMKTSSVQAAMAMFGTGYLDDAAIMKHGRAGATLVGTLEVFAGAGIMAQNLDNVKTVDPKDGMQYISIIHATIEGGDKLRGKKDGGIRDSKPFKCTPVITGEVKPEEASTSARVLNLGWSRPDENKLTSVQSNSDALPVIGYNWLMYLSKTELNLVDGFKEARNKYLTQFTAARFTNPGRLATIYVMLKSVWGMLCDSPMGDVFKEFSQEFSDALNEAIVSQGKAVTDETEVERFLTGVRELISSAPTCLESDEDDQRKLYFGKVIGKKIGNTIFLLPKVTLAELERLKIFSQAPTVSSLSKELNDLRLLKLNDNPHLQSKQMVGGRRVRGWWLSESWDAHAHEKDQWDAKNDTGGSNVPKNPLATVNKQEYRERETITINTDDKENSVCNGTNGTNGTYKGIDRLIDSDITTLLNCPTTRPTVPVASLIAKKEESISSEPKPYKPREGNVRGLVCGRILQDSVVDGILYKFDQVVYVKKEIAEQLYMTPLKQAGCNSCGKPVVPWGGREDFCKACYRAMAQVKDGNALDSSVTVPNLTKKA